MSFSLQDFHELKAVFQETLYSRNGEPVSCQLYGCTNATGALHLTFEGVEEQHLHIAEACNIASVINSIMRLLSLPRSNVACEELSEILILRLDILREYIHATAKGSKLFQYQPSEPDKVIQRWAGFLKHPSQYVFAHHCFTKLELSLFPEFVEIDSEFLARWEGLSNVDKDKRKGELAHSLVSVTLPSATLLKAFFASCANHVDSLIKSSTP
jgi:hypothetical protein